MPQQEIPVTTSTQNLGKVEMIEAYATVIAAILGGILGYGVAWLKIHIQLLVDFDKELRAERIRAYKSLVNKLAPLPKYSEPIHLQYKQILDLANSLRGWYFEEGGLLLSEMSREKYFDFQDALKIIHLKRKGEWYENLCHLHKEESFRKRLGGINHVHGEFLFMSRLGPETIPDNVPAKQNGSG